MMGKSALGFLVAGLMIALSPGSAAAFTSLDQDCLVPSSIVHPWATLEKVAAARKARQPVRILLYATAAIPGSAVSAREAAYPFRFVETLRQRWPETQVELTTLSQPRTPADRMMSRLPGILAEYRPTLLVWQTGTVDAIRGVDVNDFGDALEAGIDTAEALGVDLVLIDAQYGGLAPTLGDFSPYLNYMEQIARGRDVLLFRRYDIMKHWSETGMVDFGGWNELSKARQREVADRVHLCLGQLLGLMVDQASR
jgi:hypothetical protein